MTTESHIAALQRRHRELEEKIEGEMAHISHDDLQVATLKRKKLEIKDQISRLRPGKAA